MRGDNTAVICSKIVTMRSLKHPADVGLREILFEFKKVGRYLKVSAIDPYTSTEVSMIGDPKQSEEALKRVATRKLIYVMDKKGYSKRGRRLPRGQSPFGLKS